MWPYRRPEVAHDPHFGIAIVAANFLALSNALRANNTLASAQNGLIDSFAARSVPVALSLRRHFVSQSSFVLFILLVSLPFSTTPTSRLHFSIDIYMVVLSFVWQQFRLAPEQCLQV